MSKRKYTDIKKFEHQIIAMRKAGYTRQEIADKLGLEKEQIKGWISRYNREQARIAAGLPPKRHGRSGKDMTAGDIVLEQQYEINRLKIENQLLRDFMQSVKRK